MITTKNNDKFSISGSKLETYLSCPKKYYYSFVRKLQKPYGQKAPLLAFDQALHKSLGSFYKFHNKLELFDFNKLLKSLNYNWHSNDYESEEQSEELKATAASFLKTYFETYCKGEDHHADQDNFFKAEMGDIIYSGKIDRIDQNPDGTLEIIDYKTGKMPLGGAEELANTLSIQLLFAACDVLWPMQVKRLTYIYLKENKVLYVERNEEQIEAAKVKLFDAVKAISKEEFEPKASNACAWCDYKSQCPEGQKAAISMAKLRLYLDCPKKYSFKYLEKVQTKSETKPALLFYNYITTMLYNIYKEQKIYSTEKLLEHAEKALLSHPELDEEARKDLLSKCQSAFSYINKILKTDGFKNVLELKPDLRASKDNMLLNLQAHRIDKLPNGKRQIVVYKTGKAASTENELKNDTTSALFWYIGKELYGDELDSIAFVYLIPGITVTFVPDSVAIDHLKDSLLAFVGEKAFEGCKGSLCSWCDYYGPCPEWKIKPHETAGETQEEFRKRIRLSYSKMSLYLNCPRSYKKVYVDGVRSKPQPYFDFGTAIHETFEHIFDPSRVWTTKPTLEDLIGEYEVVRLKYRSGMHTPEIEEKYHQDGIRQLTLYYNQFMKDNDFRPAHAIEEYFEIPCGKYAVMTGFIDRIDKLPDGTYEILDYKTEPTLRPQEEVDHDKQLSIYFMAAENTLGLKVSKLSLLMLDHDKKIETTRNHDDIPSVIEAIDKTAYDMIHETEFAPKKNKYCKSCDYLADCPLKAEILADQELISMQKFEAPDLIEPKE